MDELEEIWERLRAAEHLVRENPAEGRRATTAVLALLSQITDPPVELSAFAAQIDGTAWRASGAYEAAEESYQRANALYHEALKTSDDPIRRRDLMLAEADLRRRWSLLCTETLDWDRSSALLNSAEERYTVAGNWHEVGRVHLARAQLLWERQRPGDRDRAVALFGRAVEMIDPKKRWPAFAAAKHNLVCALTLHDNPSPQCLEEAFRALQRGRLSPVSRRRCNRQRGRQLFGHADLTVSDANRRFLQGKILLLLGRHDEAKPFLETARAHLIMLGNYARDVFAATLDLADCYLWIYRRPWRKVADLLAQTFELSPQTTLAPEVRAALDLFQVAVTARRLQTALRHLDVARRHHLIGDQKP